MCVFAVIVANPELLALTTPDDETVATAVLLLDLVTVLSSASLGETVALMVVLFPITKLTFVLSNDIFVGVIVAPESESESSPELARSLSAST